MRRRLLSTAIAFALTATGAFAQVTVMNYSQNVLNARIACSDGVSWTKGTYGYRVNYGPYDEKMWALQYASPVSWSGQTHMDVRVRNVGTDVADLEFAVASQNGQGWIWARASLAPGTAQTITMPLRDAMETGKLFSLPSPTDTNIPQISARGNFFGGAVNAIYFWNKAERVTNIEVESIVATTHNVPTTAIVDEFGQQKHINFPGKVTSVADMQAKAATEPTSGAYPFPADAYGGVLGGKNYGVSTRWRTIQDNGKWYIVTPAGNRFFSSGVNEVGAQAFTPTGGREGLFSNLSILQTLGVGWGWRDGYYGFYPYLTNLQRKYGTGFQTKAENVFTARMKNWGFNTLGASSWDPMLKQKNLTSTFSIWLRGSYRTLDMYQGKVMADAFDGSFGTAVRYSVKQRFSEMQGALHAHHMGVYFENELAWGQWDRKDVWFRYAIARSALLSPTTASHRELVSRLKAKYITIQNLNAKWGAQYPTWDALTYNTAPLPNVPTPDMADDFQNFQRDFAFRYLSTVRAALTENGYQGLFLGPRFNISDYTPEILEAATETCDVLTFNIYQANPRLSNPGLKELDFPIMITEFAFGAADQGRVGMPLYPTLTEADRIDSLKRWFGEIKTWNNMVGAHWYRWEDFPVTGKADGDNMSQGLISITDNPYTDFVNAYRTLNTDLMRYLAGRP